MKKWLLLLCPLLSSCSVIMAANAKGTSVETIQKASTREDLIACGASLVSSEQIDHRHIDIFKIAHERSSLSRALLNGILDITTGCLWELAGTPIEIAYSQDSFFYIKVFFDNQDRIQTLELLPSPL